MVHGNSNIKIAYFLIANTSNITICILSRNILFCGKAIV